MVRNAIYSSVVSAVGTLPDAIRSGWEAETGPPLTSVGLSVSCNRKWEKIERERRKKTQTSDRYKLNPLTTVQTAPVSTQS